MNNTKIQNLTQKIETDTKGINEAVNLYKEKLTSAIK